MVSAVVPARNEARNIERLVRSLAAEEEIAEVIVVNDESADATGAILARLAAELPVLRVLQTGGLPQGWVGKSYAASKGAAEARGAWLLFTDADTLHLPGATARALHDAQRTGAALVSYSPEQETPTWWERALIPFVFCQLAQQYAFSEVSSAESPAAAANGQYLLIRRDAYDAIGGHTGVSSHVLEDVELARRAKQAGYRLHFAPGPGIVRARMYSTLREMWQGWTKNLYPLMGGTRAALWSQLIAVVPWLGLGLLLLGFVHSALAVLGLLVLIGRHAAYAALLRRNGYPLSRSLYYLPAVVLYAAVLVASARRYASGRVVWKGREYSVGAP